MKYFLEHQDVHPGLVVGRHQVPAPGLERVQAGNLPADIAEDPLGEIVDPDPVVGDAVEQAVAEFSKRFQGNRQLDQLTIDSTSKSSFSS